VANERRLKLFESVGHNSSSVSRMAQAEDLGIVGDAAAAAAAAKTGNLQGIIGAGLKLGRGAAMPEKTRNQLAQLLLSQGGDAATNLAALNQA
jgi:TPP-dependent pyruvate/acetoin dehydrogenase alpha subunit